MNLLRNTGQYRQSRISDGRPLHHSSNGCATTRTAPVRRRVALALAACVVFCAAPSTTDGGQDGQAQRVDAASNVARSIEPASVGKFLLGGAIGLGTHEAGHLAFDAIFGADPGVRRVSYHGIPFFAVTHRSGMSPRRELVISSAGFWVQHAESEWLLSRRPRLRRDHAPLAKGVLAFDVLTSGAYAFAAFTKSGPEERDTRGIAESARIDERWVGAMVLAPAVLDTIRYFDPDAAWARWTSRGAKVVFALLAVR